MVSALRLFSQTTKDTTTKIHGRFYGSRSRRPVSKAIHTQRNAQGRAPRLDLILSDNKLQPHIHDAVVEVVHRNTKTRFHIFVKNHRRLRPNAIIARWDGTRSWKGDILIMRKGIIHELVNLRSGDARLADFAVKKFVELVRQKPRFYIPRRMVFRKP